MKGLILTHMGKREEGLELVKKGVRLDLTSHIVWHVFGLIQKGEKNYEEALKSYTQALRFDKVSWDRALRTGFRVCSYVPRVLALAVAGTSEPNSDRPVRVGNFTGFFPPSRLCPSYRLRSQI